MFPMADEKPKLTLKQAAWLKHYIETGNATEAARRAGYRGTQQSLSAIGYENLKKLQLPVAELMDRMGLSDACLMQKLREGLDAVVTRTATDHGAISDEREYVDYPTRHSYLDTALKLKGKYPAAKVHQTVTGDSENPVILKHDFDDLRDLPADELLARYREKIRTFGGDREGYGGDPP